MTFLRLEKKSLLLGRGGEDSYLYIPLASVIEVVESGGDVVVHYKGIGGASANIVLQNTSVSDVLSDANVLDI